MDASKTMNIKHILNPLLRESSQSPWVFPSEEALLNEYNVEYKHHIQHDIGPIFPTFEDFYRACANGEQVEINSKIDSKIANRSHTQNYGELIDLISSYRSYPAYRNEKTVMNLYDRIQNGESLDMPIILRRENNLRVMSGNTRMDVAFQQGTNPVCLIVDIPEVLQESKQVGTLYHFTRWDRIRRIIQDRGLRSNLYDYISFSRDYRLRGFGEVRLTFDGNTLSEKYKIEPFQYVSSSGLVSRSMNTSESEERIVWPRGETLPILNSRYCLKAEILPLKSFYTNISMNPIEYLTWVENLKNQFDDIGIHFSVVNKQPSFQKNLWDKYK